MNTNETETKKPADQNANTPAEKPETKPETKPEEKKPEEKKPETKQPEKKPEAKKGDDTAWYESENFKRAAWNVGAVAVGYVLGRAVIGLAGLIGGNK